MPYADMKKIADGLKQAIQAELEGQSFYLMAAQTTKDPKGKEVFEQLAKEEGDHASFLKAQYGSVLDTGKPDEKVKLGDQNQLETKSPIFSEDIRSRLADAHFEMTALSIGMQLELAAKNFYSEQAEQTTDFIIKGFYLELANWETSHYRALLTQLEDLKAEYWAQSGFLEK